MKHLEPNPLISVIVPVYNTEKYLDECLNSIQNQLYVNFEVLMISDGSTDKSNEICESFAAQDKRFRFFYKENGGVSSARNLGLENAAGSWVCFVDSDDQALPNYISELKQGLKENVDFVINGFWKKKKKPTQEGVYSKDELLQSIDLYPYGSYGNLFSMDIIRTHHIRFDEKIHYGEDAVFALSYFQYMSCIYFADSFNYFYRKVDELTLTKKRHNFNVNYYTVSRLQKSLLVFIDRNSNRYLRYMAIPMGKLLRSVFESAYDRKERQEKIALILTEFQVEYRFAFQQKKKKGFVFDWLMQKKQFRAIERIYHLMLSTKLS